MLLHLFFQREVRERPVLRAGRGLDPMNSSIIQTGRKVKQGNAEGEHKRQGEECDAEMRGKKA
jgi:hypothetical protein